MKILVVGDSCKDIFRYGSITRLTPEAPVPVFNPKRETSNDGMAKNVSRNIESLESTVYTITNKNSIKKIRYVDKKSNQLVLRVDEHDYCKRIDKDILSKIKNNKCSITMIGEVSVDAIIVSDYCKGFLESDDIEWICNNNKNVFVDTKKKLGTWIKNADFIKINELEYKKNHELLSDEGFEDKLIVTLGSKGCRWNDVEFPVDSVPVRDVSGAGDTFLAGLVRGYLQTKSIERGIELAQKCTTLVVQKHGVATISIGEIE